MSRLSRKIGRFIRRKVLPTMMKTGEVVSKAAGYIPVIGKVAGPIAKVCSHLTNKVAQKVIDAGDRRAAEREARN